MPAIFIWISYGPGRIRGLCWIDYQPVAWKTCSCGRIAVSASHSSFPSPVTAAGSYSSTAYRGVFNPTSIVSILFWGIKHRRNLTHPGGHTRELKSVCVEKTQRRACRERPNPVGFTQPRWFFKHTPLGQRDRLSLWPSFFTLFPFPRQVACQ
jgi:hypothetical protein